MPAVSVIVPVYNTEEYLTRCVNSILSQTFSDFELILVDNGSTDTCPLICDEYAGSDERVVVIHKKEKGAGNARNAGLDYALQSDSKWIVFVDSDDWIDPCCLELLCRSAVQGNSKVQVCDYARAAGQDNTVQFAVGDVRSITPERLYCKKHILSIVPWAKLYDKELWQGIRFPGEIVCEDEFTIYKVMFQCREISYLSAPLYCYTYAYVISDHISEAEQDDNNKSIVLSMRKSLRKHMRKYRQEFSFSDKKNLLFFEKAYPARMKYYWLLKSLKSRFKR